MRQLFDSSTHHAKKRPVRTKTRMSDKRRRTASGSAGALRAGRKSRPLTRLRRN